MSLLEIRELELDRDVFIVADIHDNFQDSALEDTVQGCSNNCSTCAVECKKVRRQTFIDVLGRLFKQEGLVRVFVKGCLQTAAISLLWLEIL